MSVSWGKNPRYKYTSAGELHRSSAPPVPAVYAVTYKQNPASKPKSHTVLYFGHAENLAHDLPDVQEKLQDLWNKHAGNTDELYIFIYPMPGSTEKERAAVHEQLLSDYGPSGNF